jgi:hypothetical protein
MGKNASLKQLDKFVASKACALDDAQRQPATQIAVVLGHDHATAIAGAPQNGVAAGLVVNLKAGAFQGVNDLARLDGG